MVCFSFLSEELDPMVRYPSPALIAAVLLAVGLIAPRPAAGQG
jgi:hypothetical protein